MPPRPPPRLWIVELTLSPRRNLRPHIFSPPALSSACSAVDAPVGSWLPARDRRVTFRLPGRRDLAPTCGFPVDRSASGFLPDPAVHLTSRRILRRAWFSLDDRYRADPALAGNICCAASAVTAF